MSVITTATNLLVFINAVKPELTKLFDAHHGNVPAARRDLQSLLPEVARGELEIDKALAELDAPARGVDADASGVSTPREADAKRRRKASRRDDAGGDHDGSERSDQ